MKLDDGRDIKFIPVPKTVAKKLRETKLSERERKLVDIILEQTLGYEAFKRNGESYRRTSKAMSSRYLPVLSDMPRSTVNYELDRLQSRSIVVMTEDWFKGQKTRCVGLNLDVDQWDKITSKIALKEYTKLHKQAKQLVKEWWEIVLSGNSADGWTIEQGKKRDRIDLIVFRSGVRRESISVIVKVSWGDTMNWDHLVIPDKPNTVFCIVNKPMTMMAMVTPDSIKDLTPEDGHYRVPMGVNAQGEDRITVRRLASNTSLGAASAPSGGKFE